MGNEIVKMHQELMKDMQIVNPTWIYHFEDDNLDSKIMTKAFKEAVIKIKDNETPTPEDFITLSHIKSML